MTIGPGGLGFGQVGIPFIPPKPNNLEGAKQALREKVHNNKINVLKGIELLLQLSNEDIEEVFLRVRQELDKRNIDTIPKWETYSSSSCNTLNPITAQEIMIREAMIRETIRQKNEKENDDWKNKYGNGIF